MRAKWLITCLLFAAPAAAQTLEDYDYEQLTFRGVSLQIGYASPDKVEPTVEYAVRVDLDYLGPYVRIVPGFAYWSSRFREEELARFAERLSAWGAQVTPDNLRPIDWRNFAFTVDGQAVWETPVGVNPFVGLGAGLHVLDGKGPAIADTFVEDLLDTVTAGLAGSAGVDWVLPVGARLYGEARYTLLSDVRYWSVQVGAGFLLPNHVSHRGR